MAALLLTEAPQRAVPSASTNIGIAGVGQEEPRADWRCRGLGGVGPEAASSEKSLAVMGGHWAWELSCRRNWQLTKAPKCPSQTVGSSSKDKCLCGLKYPKLRTQDRCDGPRFPVYP